MSKELATYFSPFYDISTQSMEEIKTQPMVKENVIDAVTSVKDRDLNLIKKLEAENQDLKSNMHNF